VPITRLSDLSPLDRLGLPVYSATTPLALDLTTHLGKGFDAEQAQLSALMEAVERVSAESVSRVTRRRTLQEMVCEASTLDPRSCDLPNDTAFRPNRRISWTEGYDLLRREAVWVARDLVVSPPTDGVLRHVDSNGLASGNTLLEAVVHGICEVIERDTLGQHLFCTLFVEGSEGPVIRPVDVSSLPNEAVAWTKCITANGMTLEIDFFETDVDTPVFRSVLVDEDFAGTQPARRRQFIGFGSSPNAALAVMRSMAEAVQSRTAIVQGARDSFNAVGVRTDSRSTRDSSAQPKAPALSFTAVPTFSSTDLLEDLRHLLSHLKAAGFTQVIAVNLTRPDLGIPVVRIRIPGMTSFAVNRKRVGWRCLRHLL
jgi:ribosomal protein S12 methylthiotransferase accessory factor